MVRGRPIGIGLHRFARCAAGCAPARGRTNAPSTDRRACRPGHGCRGAPAPGPKTRRRTCPSAIPHGASSSGHPAQAGIPIAPCERLTRFPRARSAARSIAHPAPAPALDERLHDPAAYEFNQQAKGVIGNEVTLITTVISDWLEAAAQGVSDSDIPVMGTKQAPLQVTYPIATCLTPPPAAGLVGVIVSPTGQLVSAVLLDSTGYTVLDDKALDMARRQTFPPTTGNLPNPSAHWLPIEVQYDSASCTP